MRNLKENPCAIPSGLVGAGGASMVQVKKNLLAVFDDRVFLPAGYVYNCADTARIVLTPGFV